MQTLTFRTLYVFVVIDHGRRRIRHWNVTEHPIAPWIWRQMIEATAWGGLCQNSDKDAKSGAIWGTDTASVESDGRPSDD